MNHAVTHNEAQPATPAAPPLPAPSSTPPPATQSPARASKHARRSNGSGLRRLAMWSIVALIGTVIWAVMASGIFSERSAGMGNRLSPSGSLGSSKVNRTYGFYHDRDYEDANDGARWNERPTRTQSGLAVDAAAIGSSSRWEYDGPWNYGPYGMDGAAKRASGHAGDPLYSDTIDRSPDVFTKSGDLDPSGGLPVGVAPGASTNPYYDPYAPTYSNPYANRLRMTFGEGYGRAGW